MQPFDEILRRVLTDAVDNKKPSETDLAELRFIALDIDRARNVVGAWIGPDGQPNVREIHAQHGDFEISPLEPYHATRIGNQSVNDNTETAITFNAASLANQHFSRPFSDGAKIKVANSGRSIGVAGTIEWATNGTGRRGIHLNLYDAADTLLTGVTLHSLLPTGIAADTLPFWGGFWLPLYNEATNYPTLDYIKLTAIQTSGGALNIQNCRAWFWLLR